MTGVSTGRGPLHDSDPTAVVRIHFDTDGELSEGDYRRGLSLLAEQGVVVVGTERGRTDLAGREIEVVAEFDEDTSAAAIGEQCARAFGVETTVGVVTFISRGTDSDARSVLRRFGVDGVVRRDIDADDEEVVTVTMSYESERRVPESRLHTALEAALNCEVRIERV